MNNDVFPNKFKAALAAKQVQIGCWSALSNPISTEVLGLAGFDWLVLDLANLLSGYFFYLALHLNEAEGVEEVPYVSRNYPAR